MGLYIIVTEFGEVLATPEIVAAFEAAPKRGDGKPDRRTIAGRKAFQLEREAILAARMMESEQ
jgi:hypothetical protein